MKKYRIKRLSAFVWIAALCLCACLGACRARGNADHSGLTILSFNIRYDNPQDGEHSWPHRQNLAAGTVLFHKADLIGMQEALRHQIEDLIPLLPGYDWIGVGREDGKAAGEFSPLFYKCSRLEPLAQSTFWLSETPDVAGSRSWDAALPRIVTWAKFRDAESGLEFFAFNTHFDHRGETARVESAALILKKVKAIAAGAPVIVTGDFNCTPDSEPYRILTTGAGGISGLKDTRNLVDGPYGGSQTFNGFREDINPEQRIDYVFTGMGIQVLRFGVIADRWGGRFASDHYPVLAEILLGR